MVICANGRFPTGQFDKWFRRATYAARYINLHTLKVRKQNKAYLKNDTVRQKLGSFVSFLLYIDILDQVNILINCRLSHMSDWRATTCNKWGIRGENADQCHCDMLKLKRRNCGILHRFRWIDCTLYHLFTHYQNPIQHRGVVCKYFNERKWLHWSQG